MTSLHRPGRAPMEAERHPEHRKLAVLTRVNHDLRSPLSVIVGVFELLDGALLTEGQRRYLQLGMKAADELLALADGLRLYSALERNLLSLQAGPVDLQSIAQEALQHALADRQIAIETDHRPALRVRADEGYLKIALASLARHLADHLPGHDGDAPVLALRQRLGDDGMVVLEVYRRPLAGPGLGTGAAAAGALDELGVVNGVRLIELMGGRVAIGAAKQRLEVRLPAVRE